MDNNYIVGNFHYNKKYNYIDRTIYEVYEDSDNRIGYTEFCDKIIYLYDADFNKIFEISREIYNNTNIEFEICTDKFLDYIMESE